MTATSATPRGNADKNAIRPFHVNVPEAELTELRRRINATRWPERETVTDASQGVQLATIQKLARYWGTEYDWRKCEARLNALPQFMTEIDGLDIHFIHVRSKHDNALPLIVTHGWPGSIIEQLKIIDPLTNPTAHGASASDAFHVVIPSMPGYGFSGKPTTTGWDPARIARAWTVLMKRLGYTRYVAQGGDWGALVTEHDGRAGASGIARHPHQHARHGSTRHRQGGLHRRAAAARPLRRREDTRTSSSTSSTSTAWATPSRWRPARRRCTGSRIPGRPGRLDPRPRRAQLRAHRARLRRAVRGPHARRRPRQHHALLADEHGGFLGSSLLGKQVGLLRPKGVTIPVAVSVFPDELYQAPRSWAERAYPKLIHYNKLDKGGHFAAWEQPKLFVDEVRAGFRSLRT